MKNINKEFELGKFVLTTTTTESSPTQDSPMPSSFPRIIKEITTHDSDNQKLSDRLNIVGCASPVFTLPLDNFKCSSTQTINKPNSNLDLQLHSNLRMRDLFRRNSHTLLILPEQKQISTISSSSGNSHMHLNMRNESGDPIIHAGHIMQLTKTKLSLNPSLTMHRKSTFTGWFNMKNNLMNEADRRCSQPLLSAGTDQDSTPSKRYGEGVMINDTRYQKHKASNENPPRILSKRVSWLSIKQYDDSDDILISGTKTSRRPSSTNISEHFSSRSNSRANIHYNSALQLDISSLADRGETPPSETISWSFAGDQIIYI